MAKMIPPPLTEDTNSFEYQDYFYKLQQASNSSGGGGTVNSVTAGSGILITGTASDPIISSTVNGTVLSVGLSAPGIFSVSGSPVTSSGTLSFSLNAQPVNTIFAGPASGGSAVPTFRSLTTDDFPTVNADIGAFNNFTVTNKGLITSAFYQEYVPVYGTQQPIIPSADPDFGNVILLLHFDQPTGSRAWVDSSIYNRTPTVTYVGGTYEAQSTTIKYGTAAAQTTLTSQNRTSFPSLGVGDPLTFGTNDFTVELWGNFTSVTTATFSLVSSSASTTGGWGLTVPNTGKLAWNSQGSGIAISTNVITINTWHHLAASRSGGTLRLFIDGVLEATVADTTNYNFPALHVLGGIGVNTPIGFVDDIRVTNGVSRYNAAFTPPTTSFPDGVSYSPLGPRIQADFSAIPFSNRYIFKTTIVDGLTDVGAMPNGANTNASFTAYNGSDVNLANYIQLRATSAASEINSSSFGGFTGNNINVNIAGTTIGSFSLNGFSTTALTAGTNFTVNSTGNITRINGATTSWPASNTTGSLRNNGSGTLTWSNSPAYSSITLGGGATLSTYAEGVFTPTLLTNATNFTTVTYNAARGARYIKIGKIVHFQISMRTDSITVGSASGNLLIGGLPFTSVANTGSTTDGFCSVSVGLATGWGANSPLAAIVLPGTTTLQLLYRPTLAGDTMGLPFGNAATTASANYVVISGTYYAAT